MTIEDRLREYIVSVAGLSTPPGDHDALVTRGFVASVRLLDLVGFLEDTFAIRMKAADLVPERLATVAQIAELVRARSKR